MLVVSNTSPLSNLSIVGLLDLLRLRYGKVLVPEYVERELLALSHPLGLAHLRTAFHDGWVEVRRLPDRILAETHERRVDSGEAEAIALAELLNADKLIIDDKLGRELARERGLRAAGILGELLYAKSHGRVASVGEAMDQLQSAARFYIHQDLRAMILREAGE